MRADVERLDHECARLTEATAAGGQLVPLLDALKERQARRPSVLAALASADVLAGTRPDWKRIEAEALTEIRRWRTLLKEGVAGGRQFLREVLVSPLKFTPDGRRYRFEGEARGDRLLAGVVGPLDLMERARQVSNLRPPV